MEIVLAKEHMARRDGRDIFPLFVDEDMAGKIGYEPWMRPLPSAPKNKLSEKYSYVSAA